MNPRPDPIPAEPGVRRLSRLIGLAVLLALAAVIPTRLFVADGDEFSYIHSVTHHLATGDFKSDEWLAPSMPVLTAAAAALTRLTAGNVILACRACAALSLVVLLGLVMALTGLITRSRVGAWLAAAFVLCNPFYFFHALTFTSNVLFEGFLLAAVYLMIRRAEAPKKAYLLPLLLAAAFGAVGVRIFGVILLPLAVLVALRKRDLPGLLATTLGAFGGVAWQLHLQRLFPTWGRAQYELAQHQYWSHPISALGHSLLEIPFEIVYLVLFLIVPIVALAGGFRISRHPAKIPAKALIHSGCALVVLGFAAVGTHRLFPFLPWYLSPLAQAPASVRTILTSAVLLYVALVLGLAAGPILRRFRVSPANPTEPIAAMVALVLGLQLALYKTGDVYLFDAYPFLVVLATIALTRLFPSFPRAVIAICLVGLAGSAGVAHLLIARQEAAWSASGLAAAEANSAAFSGATPAWLCDHGAFDRYLAGHDGPEHSYQDFWSEMSEARKSPDTIRVQESHFIFRPAAVSRADSYSILGFFGGTFSVVHPPKR